jgi:hypothetical protein
MIGERMWRAGKPTRSEIKEAYDLRFFTGGPLRRAGQSFIVEPRAAQRGQGIYVWETRVRNRVINDRTSRHISIGR